MAMIKANTVNVKCFFDKELAQEVVEKAAMKGLRKLGEEILTEAKELCPVDSGTLRQSGSVRANSKNKTVEISFNTPYALKMHEGTNFNFSKIKNPKAQAKYLEQPFNERVKEAQWYAEKEIGIAIYKERGKGWKS